jgi:hypothetical protein
VKVLTSILKRIVEHFSAKKQESASERLFVAAFGKHPGWDDHIDDIGLETDTLVAVKRMIYVQGIGSNIDSGSWDKLQAEHVIEKFKHIFVWRMDGNIVVGRMWSSRDGKGRSSYPMVVCVQCSQLPLSWILENILPRLEQLERACVQTTSADGVRTAVENAANRLRRLVQQYGAVQDVPMQYQHALARLAEQPDLGPDRQGLYRVLYHIDREVFQTSLDTGKSSDWRPTLIRVPASASTAQENILLWFGALLAKFDADAPILVIVPQGRAWMDMVVGEPTDQQLYCLRAALSAIPLTSSIPYKMGPDFVERVNKLIGDPPSDNARQSLTGPA